MGYNRLPAAKKNLIERSPEVAKFVTQRLNLSLPPSRARSLNGGANGEGKKEGRWKNLRHAILGRSRGKTAAERSDPSSVDVSRSVGPKHKEQSLLMLVMC